MCCVTQKFINAKFSDLKSLFMDSFTKVFQALNEHLRMALIGFCLVLPFTALSLEQFIPDYFEVTSIYVVLLTSFCLSAIFYITAFITAITVVPTESDIAVILVNLLAPVIAIVIISFAMTINHYIPFLIDIYIWGYIGFCFLVIFFSAKRNQKK